MSNAWSYQAPAPSASGRAMSLEEWSVLPRTEPGELVAGILREEELPDALHELAVSWLVFLFRSWLKRDGFVFASELKIQLSDDTGRKPDLTVILPGGHRPAKHGPLTVAPDLVVEVVTPTPRDERRDRVEKMGEYEAKGIRWYWLLDPALGTLEIFELNAQHKYTRVVAASTGRLLEVPGCAGLVVDLDQLWAELERLGD